MTEYKREGYRCRAFRLDDQLCFCFLATTWPDSTNPALGRDHGNFARNVVISIIVQDPAQKTYFVQFKLASAPNYNT